MKPFIIVLLLLVIGLQYKLWFAEGNFSDILHIRNEYKQKKAHYQRVLTSNRKLQEDIKAFKDGGDVLEEKARVELGMVKEDEVFYQIVKR